MEHPSPQQPTTPNPFSPSSPQATTTAQNTTTTTTTAFSTRLAAKNPALHTKLTQMSLQLAPLVQLTTGAVHPAFPQTLLAFWLLTDDQLDALAHFYHQRTPCAWTAQYPCPVDWPAGLSLEDKRRRLGRFIGLRGDCDGDGEWGGSGGAGGMVGRTEREIEEGARRARMRGREEEEEVRRKMGWY
ncbi:hypothetical protein NEMBOFW57_002251 [Staphylotrichum longicolle]|uniref:Beta-xylosidase n=1 Tax=Staphylotrichum longicolle TaxID=669026 RepID=A0AAD4I2B9_9PEZI|nr:hypothetical protein NEMBOFW57_002251 [Staphylotrichum longicolle]